MSDKHSLSSTDMVRNECYGVAAPTSSGENTINMVKNSNVPTPPLASATSVNKRANSIDMVKNECYSNVPLLASAT